MTTAELASGLSRVAPSRIRELADIAFSMPGVLRLHFGESNMPTPQFIKDAAAQALAEGYTFYTENAGLPGLRRGIAAQYRKLQGVDLKALEEIVITASGVQALNVSIRCAIDPGDEALILTPNWPNSTAIVSMFGGIPKEIPLAWQGERYTIDFDALEAAITPQTRLLVCTSPSNPLGWVATVREQRDLLDFCRRHRLWLLADEVYERIYYADQVAPSILKLCGRDDAVIVAQSFSKTYCMTGWRLGWLVSRTDLAAKAAQLNEFIVSHAPSMVQRAGELALEKGESEVQALVAKFKERGRFCYEALQAMPGVNVSRPEGAFYLFPRIDGVVDSFAFALDLLKKTKVSVAPGVAFGNGGEGAVRICTAADMSILEPAMERLHNFLSSR